MHILAFAESIQLFPDGTIFIHIALILAMIWVLNRTFFRPINRIIESREKNKHIEGGEAGAILREADEKDTRYRQEMMQARNAGYELIEKEYKATAAAREEQLGKVKTEVADKLAGEKAEIEKQTASTRATIGTEAEKMADKIAENILKV